MANDQVICVRISIRIKDFLPLGDRTKTDIWHDISVNYWWILMKFSEMGAY